MRFTLIAAATIAAACSVAPVQAATIVQRDDENGMWGYKGFDAALGRLDAVTLDISVQKHRAWQVTTPANTAWPFAIDYSVDGLWALTNRAIPGGLTVRLTGSGTTVPTDSYIQPDGQRRGQFVVTASGEGSFALDPAYFGERGYFDGSDVGRGDPTGADTRISGPAGATYLRHIYGCYAMNYYPEDFCGYARYTLTYHYTPTAELGVPEPATWLMLFTGFGLLGAGLRRRSSRVQPA